jgi:PIN domain nuclease of toxin-antitoxin system
MATERLLLDTHYWIWLQGANPRRPSRYILTAVETAARTGNLLLSVISVWEVGMLEAKGRLRLRPSLDQWLKAALATPGMTVAALTPEIALESTRLPGNFHGDPADRIIAATAQSMGARLLTADERLAAWCRKNGVAPA